MNLYLHAKKISLLLALAYCLCSCATKPAAQPSAASTPIDETVIANFEKANKLLDRGETEEAVKIYDRLITDAKASPIDNLIIYNSGVAHYELKNCEIASDRFRKVIRVSNNNLSLKSRAMLFMADVYACLGDDNKATTNLLELYQGKYPLSVEVSHAELPAKLAAAYARLGNNKEAARYFKIAERGLVQVINSLASKENQRSQLAKVLYLMGNISILNTERMTSEDYFNTLRALQKYLFKSVELDDKSWSQKSFDQILLAYDKAWLFIDNMPLPQGAAQDIAKRNRKSMQLQVAQQAILTIQSLKEVRVPDPNEPILIQDLMRKILQMETKYRNFIATNIIGTSLTAEALEAQAIKKSGRVLNPDPILEKQSKAKIRQKK